MSVPQAPTAPTGAVALGMPPVRRPPRDARDPAAVAAATAGRPAVPGLVDRSGRTAVDLRVSLTDRCNLRCGYCMPPEGLDWMPDDQRLSDDEVVRLVRLGVERLGVQEVRYTGGEPLLRRGLERIVAETTALRTADGAAVEASLTTNALGLDRRAAGLAAAGLRRVNVSLDTLRPDRFARITQRDRHADVLAGVAAAAAAGIGPIKVNAVLLPGVNDDEAPELLAWALEHGYELRVIEQMPIDAQGAWTREGLVTADDVLARLRSAYDLEAEDPAVRGGAPAQRWWVRPLGADPASPPLGRVGVIASVTRQFCGPCDRTRLTADGQVRSCLFSTSETDLRGLLRSGASDDEVADVWRAAMWGKAPAHGIGEAEPLTTSGFARPSRSMSAIGG
ncbi:GTP 3',8-cyclase MoaA [uncultured Pseudokineococcus sp.]|uniref:GTP 3',8-cyclase MoaA n=1 Tax=uncultured Pseudokineococcus sp. TaxID=1642928 RepID=UPI00260423CE|nr:GTP 3',8-cyclase MoaA [uncultured Pseudokineococcus sp.]